MVRPEQPADPFQADVDLRSPHFIEDRFEGIRLGAREIAAEVLLQPTNVGGGVGLLAGRLGKPALVGRIELRGLGAEDALVGIDQRAGDAALLTRCLFEAVDKGARLELPVRFIRLGDGFLHFFDRLLLLFHGLRHIASGFLRRVRLLLRVAKFFLHLRQVVLGKLLHRLERLRHLFERFLFDVAIAGGVLHQTLHALGEILHAALALGFRGFLGFEALGCRLFLEFLAGEPFEALVLVEKVLLAPREVFELGDVPVELALEHLRVFVARQHVEGHRLRVDPPAVRIEILGVAAQGDLLGCDAKSCG